MNQIHELEIKSHEHYEHSSKPNLIPLHLCNKKNTLHKAYAPIMSLQFHLRKNLRSKERDPFTLRNKKYPFIHKAQKSANTQCIQSNLCNKLSWLTITL